MRVLITGATGLIGQEIVKRCHEKDIKVNYLSTSKSKISQQENYKGWKLEDGLQSRFALIDNILSPTYSNFHKVIYNYHRNGLDVMSTNVKEGKTNIISALTYLKEMNSSRPNSYLSRIFFDAKAEEIEQIFSSGPKVEVASLVDLLNNVAPMHNTKWRNIKY